MDRRTFFKVGVGAGSALVGVRFLGSAFRDVRAAEPPYGALQTADANGIQLPAGFSSRVIARSGQQVGGTGYSWHGAPDGGAVFPTAGGGWIYVSNSEISSGGGGVSAVELSSTGAIVGARRILSGTSRNCAGGPTPWGTWLSCEEHGSGLVWECDPTGVDAAVSRPAMGSFNHEAAACDPVGQRVYLTEDTTTGKLRRFTPSVWGNLSAGVLEAAVVSGSTVTWTTDIASGTPFNGGEGAWYADGKVWFTTKGDNRVRELDVRAVPNTIRVIYDANAPAGGVLTGVDNIVGSRSGDLFVCEDGGNMEVVMLDPTGGVSVFLRVLNQSSSELTGPAFSPDGTRFYVSSQRGTDGVNGITYEITGPFRSTASTTTTTASTATTTTASTTTTTSAAVITLTVNVRSTGKKRSVELRWSGATAANVEVRRDGVVIATTANDGSYVDVLKAGAGTFRYRVSHPGGSPISNEVTVSF